MTTGDIGRELADLKRRLGRLERGSRLAAASIENTAVQVYDDTGSLRAIVGQQEDGTSGVNVVNGPPPPTPSLPAVEPALAALTVAWDGTFNDAQAAPLDWMRCEVHIGPTAGFTPDQSTLRDTIETAQGGSVVVPLPYTEWHVKLRSRTTAGVAGPATTAVAGTPRKAEAADITAGAITAELIAVDALTGKTITGGTITGAVVQTATSGQRITLNESNGNKILVYDATRAVAEVSALGLGLVGTGGALMVLDPNALYPTLRLTNAAGTNEAVLNVVENTPGSANPGLNTGQFTGNGFTDMKWRLFMGEDFAVMERLRNSNNATVIGGRVDLRNNSASLGLSDATNASQPADVVVTSGMAKTRGRHVIQPYVGDNNSVLFVQPGPSHTGYVLRCWDPDSSVYRFAVDRLGNTDINGILSAGNVAAGRLTITPVANTPTSSNVTGLSLKGSNIRVVATPSTSVPGTQVTGVGVTNVSSTGFTVWVTRTNTTSTGIDWIAFGV